MKQATKNWRYSITMEEILAGKSKNVEFKECLPEKSIKYMKSVVAFAILTVMLQRNAAYSKEQPKRF